MNVQNQASEGDTATADYTQRTDHQGRDIVDHAISLMERANLMCALEYLKSQNIAPTVIERVLLEPQRRRHLLHH